MTFKISTKFILIIFAVIGIILFIFFFRGCDKGKETIDVTVPEVEGEFEDQKPIYIKETDTVFVTKWRTKTETVEIETENPVNNSLAIAYQKTKDSLERYKLYLDAIQVKTFSNVFEDEFVKITNSGKVQGDLLSLKPSYTIKPRTVTTEVPETVFRLLGGFELGANKGISEFPLKVNIGLQNAKGDIIRASAMQLNGQTYFLGGYDFSIFKVRK